MARSKKWTYSDTSGLRAVQVSQALRSPVRELRTQDLDVVFQPIVDLRTGATFAHEGLVRCRVPELEDPTVLFEEAAKEKACGRLGRLIRQVMFDRAPPKSRLFVNVHPQELSARWLVRPDDPIALHDGPLCIEVTESAALDYFDLCIDVLSELRDRLNVQLVVDDLGAGHSNLKYIVDLNPSFVKLDRALITNLQTNPRQQELVRHLVSLCAALGARVVAEGIETKEELDAVRATGAQFGQGFLLARPSYPIPEVNWAFY